MLRKILTFTLVFFPLTAVNAFCLGSGYFETGNSLVNTNLTVLFLVVSLLISVSKLFFDFFATAITNRCTKTEQQSGAVLGRLVRCMLPQWVFTLGGLLLNRLLFGNNTQVWDLVLFAAAHTVYYACAARGQIRDTGKKVFAYVYGAVALVCWIYVAVNLVKLLAM